MASIEQLQAKVEEMAGQVLQLHTEATEAGQWRIQLEATIRKHEAEINQAVLDQTNHTAAMTLQQQQLSQQEKDLRELHDLASKTLGETNGRLRTLENRTDGPSLVGTKPKEKWQLSIPKDMQPSVFSGKDGEWKRWKEELEDYVEAVHPSLKFVLKEVTKLTEEILKTDLTKIGCGDDEWALNGNLYTLLKRKSSEEARSVVTSAAKDNGFEAWRLLVGRFEPQAGIRRMKELAELMGLRNKRCKNAAETNLVLLEVNRRQRVIEDIGGKPASDDTLTNVMWMAMGPMTKTHVSSKLDPNTVVWIDMKEAIMRHVSLSVATSGRGAGGSSTAMDIGSIASVGGPTVGLSPDGRTEEQENWPTEEANWPADEEGWPLEVEYHDGQLNFVKGGKGKGKGKGECWNCGKGGHRAAECTNPPSASKGKGKGGKAIKGKGKGECWTCGKLGHRSMECPERAKGKGKGYGKGGWQQPWGSVAILCSVKEARPKASPKVDEEGFTAVEPNKAARPKEPTTIQKNSAPTRQAEAGRCQTKKTISYSAAMKACVQEAKKRIEGTISSNAAISAHEKTRERQSDTTSHNAATSVREQEKTATKTFWPQGKACPCILGKEEKARPCILEKASPRIFAGEAGDSYPVPPKYKAEAKTSSKRSKRKYMKFDECGCGKAAARASKKRWRTRNRKILKDCCSLVLKASEYYALSSQTASMPWLTMSG